MKEPSPLKLVLAKDLLRVLVKVGYEPAGDNEQWVHLVRAVDGRRLTLPKATQRPIHGKALRGVLDDAGLTASELVRLL